jgi:hypothetical protein
VGDFSQALKCRCACCCSPTNTQQTSGENSKAAPVSSKAGPAREPEDEEAAVPSAKLKKPFDFKAWNPSQKVQPEKVWPHN